MNAKHTVVLSYLLLFHVLIYAQSMLGYSDVSGDFYIYDNGHNVHLEHLKIQSAQAAAGSIAYIDNTQAMKYYANHEMKDLDVNNPDFYINTDYYLFYSIAGNFSVFDDNKKQHLGYIRQYPFALADSIAALHDFTSYFYAFWKNNFVELERQPVKFVVAGDNILAWVNQLEQFRIFYHDKIFDQDDYPPLKIKAGADIVAWIDSYRYLKVFYKGETTELFNVPEPECISINTSSPFAGYCTGDVVAGSNLPLFKVGDGIVAYYDDLDKFHIFFKGKNFLAAQELPKDYDVTDNIVWWIDANNYFKIFYDGEITTAETYAPQNIKSDNNIVTYTDPDGRLKAFYKGDLYDISSNIVLKDYAINNDLIMYAEIRNIYKFFSFE